MKKDFKQNVKQSRQEKNEQVTFNENKRLREDLDKYKYEINHLKDMIKQVQAGKEPTKIFFKDIKLVRNIRRNYEYENIDTLANDILSNSQIQAITLTYDNYLISGHRRYKAIEKLYNDKKHDGEILSVNIDLNYSEIRKETFDKMQLSENEQRKDLDNLDISDLFNEYISDGKTQKEIATIFDKPKSIVSELVSLKKIPDNLRKLIKEIQYFGMSKKKFAIENLDINQVKPSIIGRITLYKIAIESTNQVKVFIELFGNKLHKEDLKQLNYTKTIKTKVSYIDKYISKSDKQLNTLKTKYKDNPKAINIISYVEKLQQEINNKLKELM